MMRKGWFIILAVFMVFSASPAKADIEAVQAIITYVGDVAQNAKEQVLKAKSMIESAQQLAVQTKKIASDAKKTIKDAEGVVKQVQSEVKTAQEKVQAIKDKVNGTINAVQSGDIKNVLPKVEFVKLNGVFDGTKIDDEMAEAVMDTLVRKKGGDSIANQKALNKALNLKQGTDMANMFADVVVLRQEIVQEEDEVQNPDNIEDAIDLAQKSMTKNLERQRQILLFNSQITEYNHTYGIQALQGEKKEAENE